MDDEIESDDITIKSLTHIDTTHDFSEISDTDVVSTQTRAAEISVQIETETSENLEKNDYKYRARGDRYIPVPSDDKYYDVKQNSTEKLEEDMVIDGHTDLIEALYRLRDFPFLLVDSEGNRRFEIYNEENVNDTGMIPRDVRPIDRLTADELRERYPQYAADHIDNRTNRYSIITITEINKRATKIALYPYIAEFEGQISELIENEYPNSAPLVEVVGNQAERAWQENQGTETEVHIAEFLNLSDITKLITNSSLLAQRCGFESTTDAGEIIDKIREIRNKVMHANRTLVHSKDELRILTDELKNISDTLNYLDGMNSS